MNVITCGALLCLHVETISNDKRIVFGACLCLSLLGTFLCNRFISAFRDEAASKKGNVDIENDVREEVPIILIEECSSQKLGRWQQQDRVTPCSS